MTVDDLLIEARGVLPHRPGPAEALAAQAAGALPSTFVATISAGPAGWSLEPLCCPATRRNGAAIPASQSRHPEINDWARPLILICDEGFQSSLAAATLPGLGMVNATDPDGGFAAWAAVGLPLAAQTRARKRPQDTTWDGWLNDGDNAR